MKGKMKKSAREGDHQCSVMFLGEPAVHAKANQVAELLLDSLIYLGKKKKGRTRTVDMNTEDTRLKERKIFYW